MFLFFFSGTITFLNFQDLFQSIIVKEEGLEATIESVSFEPDSDDDEPGDEVKIVICFYN